MLSLQMRYDVVDEIKECETAAELLALIDVMPKEYLEDEDIFHAVSLTQAKMSVEPGTHAEEAVQEYVAGEKAAMDMIVPKTVISRGGKRYKLLKKDVSWTTKPQVHAIMAILTAHMEVGDVVDESAIVEMMVANEAVLRTRQGGKRIWNYYKGDHTEGLLAHGNVEKV